ncbi:NDP-hexose 2,3-dehydratase family protein [Saccharothrix australiensis]|uniref:Oxidase EvaA n=1 Tax=Saccharothrix australiensis TaxID=2072 RepID=A0A495W1Z5_9PSEU|nr:NDP-hexose 2,3-dehydratase family protein [Saccharothrix australiensis]RKT55646.1 oxidase EvaA [Saccharothrix australiensis]
MVVEATGATPVLRTVDATTSPRLVASALATDGRVTDAAAFARWLDRCREQAPWSARPIPFAALRSWHFEAGTGNLVHDSGRFFTVEGLRVSSEAGPVREWSQPIFNQPEIGVLGFLVKEFHGVLHCLVQAKVEPGNCNGVQLSPTVQATRSNYTQVHGGRSVPYLEYFRDPGARHVIADVLQSEQGSWFYRKRNRNVVVEVGPDEDVEVREGFCWLTVGQLHRLLAEEDLVNMDARTVLSCLPFAGTGLTGLFPAAADGFTASVARSMSEDEGGLHTTTELLSWITDARSADRVRTTPIPLRRVRGWRVTADAITHDDGIFFDVVAVEARIGNREVATWTQPLIRPCGLGVVAFLVKRVAGVLHVLVAARVEPGYLDEVELAPTVQCTPENYARLPPSARPPFLDDVLDAPPERIRFDTVLSEEGGRFFHARNRYLVVELPAAARLDAPAGFRWMTLHQLVGLIRHSYYVNVQARTLTACLHGLAASGPGA